MIFAVLAQPYELKVADAIQRNFGDKYLSVAQGQWLVISQGTAKDVSDKLGITDGTNGNAVILAVSGYYGRAATNIWEWLAANWNRA